MSTRYEPGFPTAEGIYYVKTPSNTFWLLISRNRKLYDYHDGHEFMSSIVGYYDLTPKPDTEKLVQYLAFYDSYRTAVVDAKGTPRSLEDFMRFSMIEFMELYAPNSIHFKHQG